MKRVSEKYKAWQLAKTRSIIRRRSRERAKSKKRARDNCVPQKYKSKSNVIYLTAPTSFSLFSNREETLKFFSKALRAANTCNARQTLYFNLKRVEIITPDSIMYLIAIVNNVKRVKTMRIKIEGNLPENAQARLAIEKSGFYSYVSGLKPSQSVDISSRVQISCGSDADGAFIGDICEFVIANLSGNRVFTKRLYAIIMELMTNTCQHAYSKENSIMENRWYIYAENTKDSIDFVFLDTGVGIPATIRLNFSERVSQLLLKTKNDSKLISSALKGAFRTETKEEHRGKGLPGIYEDSKSGNITNLSILSGSGECVISEDFEIIENNSDEFFEGTLVCWKYVKKKELKQ